MSPETEPSSERQRLPFEPGQSRKKTSKSAAPDKAEATKKSASSDQKSDRATKEPTDRNDRATKKEAKATKNSAKTVSRAETAIPDGVSQRMVRRMAWFSGIPTSLGMATFVVSYFVVTNAWFKLPNVAVVLVSMGFFGLGVLGLTYGVLSASWDEERIGAWWGWSEFTTNLGRMTEAWRSSRQKGE